MQNSLFKHNRLIQFSTAILVKAGLSKDKSQIIAETLVEADLRGHNTHGLHLLDRYVKELENGGMTKSGNPEIINDRGAAISWNGKYLPGPWLVHNAIDVALERIKIHPVVSLTIQKCHHIGCLAAYPERATNQNFMMLLSCSDPINKTVAPFGGTRPLYSPNPIAAGIPTEKDAIIFDISTSTTANGSVHRALAEGKRLDHKWMMDKNGNPTDDPVNFNDDPPSTILPLGGLDSGYKGFALGIMVEALTNALGGFGRAEHPTNWGCSVFLQIIDPDAFGGKHQFLSEMQYFNDESLKTIPDNDGRKVRMPGSRARQLKAYQIKNGLKLYPSIIPSLQNLSERYDIPLIQ